MSTYYYLGCKKCKKESGFSFSRQIWGWGNADIINTFRFLMKHTSDCGEENLFVFSEHHDDIFGEYKRDECEDLLSYFPHSGDFDKEELEKQFELYKKSLKT